LEDKREKIRELAINLLEKFIDTLGIALEQESYQTINQSIIDRMKTHPFTETSEENRLKLLCILSKILLINPNSFKYLMADLSMMTSNLLADPYPEIKHKLCEFINILNEKLKKELGAHSKQIIISLCKNLAHQHSKVRKNTIYALGDVLSCGGGEHFGEAINPLKKLLNDKNTEVRKGLYSVAFSLILNFNIKYLNEFEKYLVIFLLSGFSDENEENIKLSKDYLEKAGKYRKDLEESLEREKLKQNEMKIDS